MKTNKQIKVNGQTYIVRQNRFRLSANVGILKVSAMNIPELKQRIRSAQNL